MRSSIIHSREFIESHGVNKPTKKCKICKIEKDKSYFPRDPSRADGRHPYCNLCKTASLRGYPERTRQAYLRYKNKHPERIKAHAKLNGAIRLGKIIKPKNCQKCGKESKRIEGHHWHGYDDKHALDVQWLCHRCHMDADVKMHT